LLHCRRGGRVKTPGVRRKDFGYCDAGKGGEGCHVADGKEEGSDIFFKKSAEPSFRGERVRFGKASFLKSQDHLLMRVSLISFR